MLSQSVWPREQTHAHTHTRRFEGTVQMIAQLSNPRRSCTNEGKTSASPHVILQHRPRKQRGDTANTRCHATEPEAFRLGCQNPQATKSTPSTKSKQNKEDARCRTKTSLTRTLGFRLNARGLNSILQSRSQCATLMGVRPGRS